MSHAAMPACGGESVASRVWNRLRSPRVPLWMLLAGVAATALAMGAGRYWLQNRDVERSLVTQALRDLGSPDRQLRLKAVTVLEGAPTGQVARIANALIVASEDRDPGVRAAVVGALELLARKAWPQWPSSATPLLRAEDRQQFIAAVIPRLDEEEPRVVRSAVGAVAVLTPPEPEPGEPTAPEPYRAHIIARLAQLAGGRGLLLDPMARGYAIQTMRRWIEPGSPVPAVLLELLEDASEPDARMAAAACLRHGPGGRFTGAPPDWEEPSRVVAALLETVRSDPNPAVRARVAVLLADLAPAPAELWPTLLQALSELGDESEYRHALGLSLASRSLAPPPPEFSRLASLALDEARRGDLITGLSLQVVRLAPTAPECQEMLGPLLDRFERARDQYNELSYYLPRILAAYGPHAAPALTRLRSIASTQTNWKRDLALQCIQGIEAAMVLPDDGAIESSSEAVARP